MSRNWVIPAAANRGESRRWRYSDYFHQAPAAGDDTRNFDEDVPCQRKSINDGEACQRMAGSGAVMPTVAQALPPTGF